MKKNLYKKQFYTYALPLPALPSGLLLLRIHRKLEEAMLQPEKKCVKTFTKVE